VIEVVLANRPTIADSFDYEADTDKVVSCRQVRETAGSRRPVQGFGTISIAHGIVFAVCGICTRRCGCNFLRCVRASKLS